MPDTIKNPQPLSPAQMAAFAAQGFTVVPDVLSPADCAAVIAAAEGLDSRKSGSFKPVFQPHRESQVFLDTLAHPRLVPMIAQLVGGQPAGLQTQMFFSPGGTRGFTAHQDNFFVRGERGRFVSAWIPLVDVTADMGSLFVYPGSHRLGLLPVRQTNLPVTSEQDVNGYAQECIFPESYVPAPQDLPVPAGAAVMLDGDLVHGSNANLTDRRRYVLLCTYIQAGASFYAGRTAKRSEVKLAR